MKKTNHLEFVLIKPVKYDSDLDPQFVHMILQGANQDVSQKIIR